MFDKSHTYRVFLAIIPPAEIRAMLRDYNRSLKKHARNFRFVSIEQVHITLQFIGNGVSGHSLESLVENISNVTHDMNSFELTFDNIHFGFPGQNIPHLLYYSVIPSEDLKELVSIVHETNKELKLPDTNKKKDHSKLINHLTVARTKSDSNRSFGREIQGEIKNLKFKPITFKVEEFHLVSSVFKEKGTIYATLATFPLLVGKEKGE
jgi:2'-5' RNA ligase